MSVATQMMPQPLLNGIDHAIHDDEMNGGHKEPKFASGLILPPPEIKSVIDRTALFVARSANPPQFEDKIRENQRQDPKFAFLNPADPYHAYYRHRMDKVVRGELDDEVVPGKEDKAQAEHVPGRACGRHGRGAPHPGHAMFLLTSWTRDRDIMKLTALFTARRGRAFLAALSGEKYSKVLLPNKEMQARLKERTKEGARWKDLDIAQRRAQWEKVKREKDKKRADDKEAETSTYCFFRLSFGCSHNFATIEFTAADATSELPPPMSVQEVESMTLAQKRMAAMIMETTAEDVEAHRARQAAAEAEAAAAVGGAGIANVEEMPMEEDEEYKEAQARRRRDEEEREREVERARAIQASSLDAGGPMKIRADYVPKLNKKGGEKMTTCTICGQQIPVDELQEHMRIELLDPRWKSQRDALEARKAQASELQRGANVVSSLKNLARTRVDIFEEEREKVVWDGHTASKANTLDKFSTNVNFDEQIAAIHRSKGLGPQEVNAIGPGIGPAAAPAPMASLPPPPASLPAPPMQGGGAGSTDGAYSAATVSSGPQPASMFPPQPAPVMLPPLHYQGMDAAQPFGYQPPQGGPPMMHPARVAALAGSPIGTPPQVGMVRSADEMEGAGEDTLPPAKRQRVAKLPGGALYPEADWIAMHPHPISLRIQLPNDPSKPEWKLDGGVVVVPELPLNLLVSTLRDRFLQHTGSSVPASKIRLAYAGKMLTNMHTIASYNLEDEDLLVLSVRDQKKK
ncbi:Splicing factor 3A subunit 1 [Grifola frondosa]|uniref:Splicing factor 3A subunit 1 n=1 Tax=Grifola frondosa TaxID=5627 RepID=A0A1C7ME61_GRIFR|nr:Splicing factor 3A subunit 1 [Grifola frondosa]